MVSRSQEWGLYLVCCGIIWMRGLMTRRKSLVLAVRQTDAWGSVKSPWSALQRGASNRRRYMVQDHLEGRSAFPCYGRCLFCWVGGGEANMLCIWEVPWEVRPYWSWDLGPFEAGSNRLEYPTIAQPKLGRETKTAKDVLQNGMRWCELVGARAGISV